MELEERKSLSQVRYDHALECLDAAKSLLENGNYKSAANRSQGHPDLPSLCGPLCLLHGDAGRIPDLDEAG